MQFEMPGAGVHALRGKGITLKVDTVIGLDVFLCCRAEAQNS